MAEQAKDFNRALERGTEQLEEKGRQLIKSMDLDAVKAELATLREQYDKVKGNVREKAVRVDHNVHSNPYPYLLGAFGVGLLAGSLLMKRH